MENAANQPARGPFSPAVNSLLQESFGADLQHLTASFGQDNANRNLGAVAHTMAQMMSPDNQQEMETLLKRIRREKARDKADFNLNYEIDTEGRQLRNPKDKSFMDAAMQNETHYSGADPHGENNMGAYGSFHQMALEEAAKGDKADANLMRAYEAASMHFLVDKHCAGHGIDKLAIQDAWTKNHPSLAKGMGAVGPGAAVKILHDQGNQGGKDKTGIDVHNRAGETWKEFGDNDFVNPLNAESRRRTAESEYTSYSELEAVRTGKKSPADVHRDGYGVNATVPEFDPAFQKKMEEQTKDFGLGNIFGTLALSRTSICFSTDMSIAPSDAASSTSATRSGKVGTSRMARSAPR